jgi:hypothetical protein
MQDLAWADLQTSLFMVIDSVCKGIVGWFKTAYCSLLNKEQIQFTSRELDVSKWCHFRPSLANPDVCCSL